MSCETDKCRPRSRPGAHDGGTPRHPPRHTSRCRCPAPHRTPRRRASVDSEITCLGRDAALAWRGARKRLEARPPVTISGRRCARAYSARANFRSRCRWRGRCRCRRAPAPALRHAGPGPGTSRACVGMEAHFMPAPPPSDIAPARPVSSGRLARVASPPTPPPAPLCCHGQRSQVARISHQDPPPQTRSPFLLPRAARPRISRPPP
jgi:hypothetical protein